MDTGIRLCAGILNVAAVLAVAGVIFADFYRSTGRKDTVEMKKTPVSAVTIAIFMLVYCIVILSHHGKVGLNTVCMVVGVLITVFGAIFQIISRVQLGRSWSNQIRIYEHHTLVTTGVYSVIRHPLYATFIVMFLGDALMYGNWLAALLTVVVFVPMMDFRARQEEKILCEAVDGYPQYMETTGRLFVKFPGRRVASTRQSDEVGISAIMTDDEYCHPDEVGISATLVADKPVRSPSSSPLVNPWFWACYVIAVGLWVLALRLPNYWVLIPLIGCTPYMLVGVVLWLLFRDRNKPAMFGVLLGTLTPFMALFAVISNCELLNISWY